MKKVVASAWFQRNQPLKGRESHFIITLHGAGLIKVIKTLNLTQLPGVGAGEQLQGGIGIAIGKVGFQFALQIRLLRCFPLRGLHR